MGMSRSSNFRMEQEQLPNPSEDLRDHIGTLIGSLSAGTNLFSSKPRAARGDVPQDAVFVYASGGRDPDRSMQEVDEIRHPIVTVTVRNSRQKTGSDLAQSIFNTLRGVPPTGYLDLVCANSQPMDMGYDSDGRHFFNMTFILAYLAV